MNLNFFAERRLLQRCARDNHAAQQDFADLSYRNQVYRTAADVNRSYGAVLGTAELEDLCKLLIVQIYQGHESLPSWRQTLYRRIQDWVTGAVILYFEQSK